MRNLVYENYYTAESPEELFLMHHGIKGQKWGIRRFQNSDGSLTAAGKDRYNTDDGSSRSERFKNGAKKALKVAGVAALAGAAAYGAYKYGQSRPDIGKRIDMANAVKNRRKLSKSEIEDRISRIKLERELKNLTEEELHPFRSVVKDVMKNSGKKVAATVATGGMLYAGKYMLTKEFNSREAAGYVTPRPKNK